MRDTKSAADQFAALHIDQADYTKAMTLAISQKWTNLEVDAKVDDLRRRIAAVTQAETPTADVLFASGFAPTLEECRTEANRLKRNATVNAWRERGQLQAALDARELRFAAIRAARTAKAEPAALADAS